jgi:hypothetical protein
VAANVFRQARVRAAAENFELIVGQTARPSFKSSVRVTTGDTAFRPYNQPQQEKAFRP